MIEWSVELTSFSSTPMTTLARLLALIALLAHVQSVKLSFPGITLRKNSAQELESREKFAPAIIASSAKKQLITLNALELCLCGAFSTMLGDFVMHPIDTIKIVQQTSLRPIGFFSAATTIFKSKGIIGFFPGVIPYLACDGLSGAIKFASFELSRAFVESKIPQKFHPLSQFICAAGAMLCCSVALVPGEVLKIRLQSGAVKSLGEGVVNIYKKDGLRGFFAG